MRIAPELSGVDDATFAAIIADAYGQMNPTLWGRKLDIGAKYLVAHLVSMTTAGGAPDAAGTFGQVQSESVGGVSRTYQTTASGTGLEATSYGDEYKRLLRQVAFAPQVV